MIARVLLRFVLSLFLASVVIFLLLRLIPGDPARVALGVTATDEAVEALARQLGTDRPLVVQYLDWVGGLLTGDFGMSLASRQDITPAHHRPGPGILILCGLAMVLSCSSPCHWVCGPPTASCRRWPRSASPSSFLTGILLVTVFVHLGGCRPTGGFRARTSRLPAAHHPAGHRADAGAGGDLTCYVRSAVLEVLDREFIRTARSAGASISEALWRHGLRNAALPVLTVAGLQLTSLIVGAVVIERVFLIPGLGSMLLDSVARRDLTAVQTIVMLLVVFTLTVNLIVDVTTASSTRGSGGAHEKAACLRWIGAVIVAVTVLFALVSLVWTPTTPSTRCPPTACSVPRRSTSWAPTATAATCSPASWRGPRSLSSSGWSRWASPRCSVCRSVSRRACGAGGRRRSSCAAWTSCWRSQRCCWRSSRGPHSGRRRSRQWWRSASRASRFRPRRPRRTLQIMTQDFIASARVSRVPELVIAGRHVLPNIAGVIIVQASVAFALAISVEAALSFLGLGTSRPTRRGDACCSRRRPRWVPPHSWRCGRVWLSRSPCWGSTSRRRRMTSRSLQEPTMTILSVTDLRVGDGLRRHLSPSAAASASGSSVNPAR